MPTRSRDACCVSAVLAFGAAACGFDMPRPPSQTDTELIFEGQSPTDAGVPTVFVARSAMSKHPLPRLFTGVLSDYHRSRADDLELAQSLGDRQLPLWVRRSGTEQTLVALEALEPRSSYSLLLAAGRVQEFTTLRARPKWARVWPKLQESAVEGTRAVAYCSARSVAGQAASAGLSQLDARAPLSTSPPALSGEVTLLGGSAARWLPVTGRHDCALLWANGPLPAAGDVLPPRVNGELAQPSVLRPAVAQGLSQGVPSSECGEGRALAPGCASVLDDRVVLSHKTPALWCFGGAFGGCVASDLDSPATVLGLTPQSRYALTLEVFLSSGVRISSEPELHTAPARPHVVISEVLANPLGMEPQQEWVELHNDGSSDVALGGWLLSDSSESATLPDVMISSGEYVLVVNDAYQDPPDRDLPAAAGTKLLRVARLGASGLSNSGEALTLTAPNGDVASEWPARSSAAGVSLARTAGGNAETGAEVLPHADPGASPGAPNVVTSR